MSSAMEQARAAAPAPTMTAMILPWIENRTHPIATVNRAHAIDFFVVVFIMVIDVLLENSKSVSFEVAPCDVPSGFLRADLLRVMEG